VVLESASVNVRSIGLVQERYAFYIVPLIVTAALCFAARPRLAWVGIPAGAIVSIWILAKLDFGLASSYSFVSPFYSVLDGRAADFGNVLGYENLNPGGFFVWVTVLAALAVGALIRWAPPGWRVAAIGLPLLVYCALAANYDFDKLLPAQDSAQAEFGLQTPQQRERGLDWVDDVLPDGAEAAFTPAVLGDIDTTRRAWWDVEFWNKALVRMYDYEPAWRDSVLPTQRMSLDPATGAIAVPDPMRYVVVPKSDRRLGIDGRPLAGTALLSLIEARRPLRARWAVSDTDGDGWPAQEKPATVRVFPPGTSAARVRVNVQLTSSPHHPPRTRYRITGGARTVSGEVRRARSRQVTLPVCVRPGAPEVLRVLVPEGGVLPPGRRVGLAITGVRVDAAGRCT
jgi:membrane protein implicated in regulation of membrane protease activity